jgi:uncharacterized protein (TIGR02466 family)|tara:strand:- start:877 stop:1488 length:612 start_codon:yes stop_codon:yes gene_type:complete
MKIVNVMPLFPSTTIVGNLDLDHDKITKRIAKEFLREGNWHDEDPFNKTQPYLHKDPKYKKLSDELLLFVNHVCSDVLSFENVNPEISLMWGTATPKKGSVHRHYHPNSILSGVYYPQNIEYTPIRFFSPHRPTILPKIVSKNVYSSETMEYQPQQGDVVLFRSDLDHDVPINTFNDTRYSVAFNIFFRGEMGHEETLSNVTL